MEEFARTARRASCKVARLNKCHAETPRRGIKRCAAPNDSATDDDYIEPLITETLQRRQSVSRIQALAHCRHPIGVAFCKRTFSRLTCMVGHNSTRLGTFS
jgi:hypothetical protein